MQSARVEAGDKQVREVVRVGDERDQKNDRRILAPS
jgi:hypothetical protein